MTAFIFGGFPARVSSIQLAKENNPESISIQKMREEVAVFEALRLSGEIDTIVTNLGGTGKRLLNVAQNLQAVATYLSESNVSW